VTKLLCIISQPPYANAHTLELLEAAMVGAVFDCHVTLLFRDDGIWSLLKNQNADVLQQRTLSKVLLALPSYDIEEIFVCDDSLSTRNLAASDITDGVKTLDYQAQSDLISTQDAVLSAQL